MMLIYIKIASNCYLFIFVKTFKKTWKIRKIWYNAYTIYKRYKLTFKSGFVSFFIYVSEEDMEELDLKAIYTMLCRKKLVVILIILISGNLLNILLTTFFSKTSPQK